MSDIDYQVECLTRDLVLLLMQRRGLELQDALRTLYTSDTYTKLQNPSTGLYFQSPGYVYDFLEKEITTGRME